MGPGSGRGGGMGSGDGRGVVAGNGLQHGRRRPPSWRRVLELQRQRRYQACLLNQPHHSILSWRVRIRYRARWLSEYWSARTGQSSRCAILRGLPDGLDEQAFRLLTSYDSNQQ